MTVEWLPPRPLFLFYPRSTDAQAYIHPGCKPRLKLKVKSSSCPVSRILALTFLICKIRHWDHCTASPCHSACCCYKPLFCPGALWWASTTVLQSEDEVQSEELPEHALATAVTLSVGWQIPSWPMKWDGYVGQALQEAERSSVFWQGPVLVLGLVSVFL